MRIPITMDPTVGAVGRRKRVVFDEFHPFAFAVGFA